MERAMTERAIPAGTKFSFRKAWIYGRTFRFTFVIIIAIGISGSILSVVRAVCPIVDKRGEASATPQQSHEPPPKQP
jgi:hypothetical protein